MGKKIIFIFTSLLLGIFLLIVSCNNELNYPSGIDTVYSFGDGQFHVFNGNIRYNLSDFCSNDISKTIVYDVYKYIDNLDNTAYIIGYYSDGTTPDEEGTTHPSIFHTNTQTCAYEKYDSVDLIPKYLILNYNTNDLTTYLTWDDVPEADKTVFSQDLDWWCQFRNTCYEKEGADLY